MLKKISLLSLSLVISLIIIEIFLSFFFPQDLTGSFRTYGKNGLLLNAKNKVVPVFHLGKKVSNYTFGEFHNRKYDLEKSDNKILILGDSFTFGWLLKDEDTFIYKLNENIDNFSFINSAAGGWGRSDQLKYLMSVCKTVNPKYIVVFLNTFDLERSTRSNLFLLDDDKIKESNNQISKLKIFLENSKIYNFSIENFHIINFLKKIFLSSSFSIQNNRSVEINDNNTNGENQKNNHSDFYRKLFLKFKEEVKICNSKVIIINLGWYNYNTSSTNTDEFIKNNINFFNKNFNFIDLNYDLIEIQENYTKFTIKNDDHPNKLGNEYLYEIIYKKLFPLIN